MQGEKNAGEKTQQDFIPCEMFYFLTVPGEGNRCKYQGGKSQAQGGNYKRGRTFTLSETDENTCCRNCQDCDQDCKRKQDLGALIHDSKVYCKPRKTCDSA